MVIGAVILLGAVGWLLWHGNEKPAAQSQQPAMREATTAPTEAKTVEGASTSAMTDKNAQQIAVKGGDYYFKPNEIRVKKGQPVTVTLTSAEGFHNFVIDEFKVKTKVINDRESIAVTFTPDKTGTFEFYCSIGHHREMGMKGNLIVE